MEGEEAPVNEVDEEDNVTNDNGVVTPLMEAVTTTTSPQPAAFVAASTTRDIASVVTSVLPLSVPSSDTTIKNGVFRLLECVLFLFSSLPPSSTKLCFSIHNAASLATANASCSFAHNRAPNPCCTVGSDSRPCHLPQNAVSCVPTPTPF